MLELRDMTACLEICKLQCSWMLCVPDYLGTYDIVVSRSSIDDWRTFGKFLFIALREYLPSFSNNNLLRSIISRISR